MMAEAPRLHQQVKALKIKAGTMGLAQDHQPHVLDAIELGKLSNDEFSFNSRSLEREYVLLLQESVTQHTLCQQRILVVFPSPIIFLLRSFCVC